VVDLHPVHQREVKEALGYAKDAFYCGTSSLEEFRDTLDKILSGNTSGSTADEK
jgi:hypothetical protein